MIELHDRRVLGAMRFVDSATGSVVARRLTIESPAGVRLIRNLSGHYVITSAPGFAAYTNRFDSQPEVRDPQPDDGALPFESVPLLFTIRDESGDFLPRLATCLLPRASNLPAAGEPFPQNWEPGPLFRLIEIPLFRSSKSRPEPNWAVVHASVENAKDRRPLAGALVLVRREGATPIGRGLCDERGEACVAVAGLPRITWPEGDEESTTLVTELDATLEVVWDRKGGGTVDPTVLEKDREKLVHQSFPIKLAAGRSMGKRLSVDVPDQQ